MNWPSERGWSAVAAVGSLIAAVAAACATLVAYQSLEAEQALVSPSESTMKIRGAKALEEECMRVARSGTVLEGSAELRRNEHLWLFVEGLEVGSTSIYLVSGQPTATRSGDWSQPIEAIGARGETGASFLFMAVAVDPSVTPVLARRFTAPDAQGERTLQELPEGASVVSTLCVERR